jgi:hypothetical protein
MDPGAKNALRLASSSGAHHRVSRMFSASSCWENEHERYGLTPPTDPWQAPAPSRLTDPRHEIRNSIRRGRRRLAVYRSAGRWTGPQLDTHLELAATTEALAANLGAGGLHHLTALAHLTGLDALGLDYVFLVWLSRETRVDAPALSGVARENSVTRVTSRAVGPGRELP